MGKLLQRERPSTANRCVYWFPASHPRSWRRTELCEPQEFVTSAEGGFTTPGGKPLDMTKPVIFCQVSYQSDSRWRGYRLSRGSDQRPLRGELALVVGKKGDAALAR